MLEVKDLNVQLGNFFLKDVSFDVKAGEIFTEQNVRSIRPGYGLKPKYIQRVIGKRAAHDIERGTPLAWDHFD